MVSLKSGARKIILANWEAEILSIKIQDPPRQKFYKISPQPITGMVVVTVIPAIGSIKEEDHSPGQPEKTIKPYL
jgi:hypothetical protein